MNLDEILTKEFGLDSLPEASRQPILQQLGSALFLNLGERMSSELSEDELKNFNDLVAEQDPDVVLEVLEGRFPNFEEILQQEIAQMKQDYGSLLG